MITVEPLSTENLREGIFCPRGDEAGEDLYEQLDAWLDGEMLRGQVARSEADEVCGFILYYPVEMAPIEVLGEGFYVIQCLYVDEEFSGYGMGSALIEAAMQDARGHGASGIAVTAYPRGSREGFEFMPQSFFEKMGFTAVDQRGTAALLFAKFKENAPVPAFAPPGFQPPSGSGSVRVDVLDCSRCYVGKKTARLLDKIAESVGKEVEVHVHTLDGRAAVLDKGMSNGVFIDGRLTFFGGPVSEDDIMQALQVALSAYHQHTDRPAKG